MVRGNPLFFYIVVDVEEFIENETFTAACDVTHNGRDVTKFTDSWRTQTHWVSMTTNCIDPERKNKYFYFTLHTYRIYLKFTFKIKEVFFIFLSLRFGFRCVCVFVGHVYYLPA